MNVLYGDHTCGKGDIEAMDTIVSHYTYYFDLIGIGREKAGNTSCAEQMVYNPSSTSLLVAHFDEVIDFNFIAYFFYIMYV